MQSIVRLIFLPVLVIGMCMASGPGSTPATRVQPVVHAGPQVGDQQIDSTIRTKLAKSKIGKDGFRFKVARGVVTWEGSTTVPQHKGAATRMARTSGAVQVVNNIQVAGGNKPGTPLKKAYVQ